MKYEEWLNARDPRPLIANWRDRPVDLESGRKLLPEICVLAFRAFDALFNDAHRQRLELAYQYITGERSLEDYLVGQNLPCEEMQTPRNEASIRDQSTTWALHLIYQSLSPPRILVAGNELLFPVPNQNLPTANWYSRPFQRVLNWILSGPAVSIVMPLEQQEHMGVVSNLFSLVNCINWISEEYNLLAVSSNLPPINAHDLICDLIRCAVGPPGLSPNITSTLCTDDVTTLAATIRQSRNFETMPILADALEEAGCTDRFILQHCRHGRHHIPNCSVLALLGTAS